jgi:GAF domain-containing protein
MGWVCLTEIDAQPLCSVARGRMDFPLDPNEIGRLKAIENLDVAKRLPDAVLDRITNYTRQHFDVPICLVTLVESECVLMVSRQGLEAGEVPRQVAFCSHTITADGVLVIADTRDDERFKANPLVTGKPHIRFYAGAPLVHEGLRLGSLCLLDRKPRRLSRGDQAELMMLADSVVSVIVARAFGLPEPDLTLALR